MLTITLPDGSTREFAAAVTGQEVAASIGAGLAKAALAIEVNGILQDMSEAITSDAALRIITSRDAEGLEIIRHDTAHILAQAIKNLYPEAQITIGPVIENGFFYDIARDTAFTPDDLIKLEAEMSRLVAANIPVTPEVWERQQAIDYFRSIGEQYKAEIIESIPAGEPIRLYRQGDFLDLCRGPHAPSTGYPKAFKLMKLAGAYWRGDSRNPMLQRIYGTAWPDNKQLQAYLTMLEEAEKRDHRKLGRDMELFHFQEEAPGMVFWHEKGWIVYRVVEQYIRDKLHGYYREVKTPILLDRSFWEASGHWEKFRENMFTSESEDKIMALKPMSCPCHVQIFNMGTKSYRDLPLRMSEFGTCHRNEASGALHGLMRVRAMTQDDGHIFCTEEQVTAETVVFCQQLREVYADFGFHDIHVKFSDRPAVRAGSDDVWDKAEKSLEAAITAAGFAYTINPGEGAFYGPKLEFVLKDAIGRDWQCGTLQVDFILPERLDANYIGADGNKHRPVMLHRAILGSLERFIGILIEQYAGKLPLWLAPVQVAILTITQDSDDYARHVQAQLNAAGLRAILDIGNDTINYKVRQYSLQKVPVLYVVGKKEAVEHTVAIRTLGQEQQAIMPLAEAIHHLCQEVALRGTQGDDTSRHALNKRISS